MWPAIIKLFQSEIDKLKNEGCKIIILEAAVLIEGGMDKLCDEVWVVNCPTKIQILRLKSRNGVSNEDALKKVNS